MPMIGLSHSADPYDMVVDGGYCVIVILRARRRFSGERHDCGQTIVMLC